MGPSRVGLAVGLSFALGMLAGVVLSLNDNAELADRCRQMAGTAIEALRGANAAMDSVGAWVAPVDPVHLTETEVEP